MEPITAFIIANPEIIAIAAPMLVQGLSWLVKKSPWGWDNTLLQWCLKNRGGLSILARYFAKLRGRR